MLVVQDAHHALRTTRPPLARLSDFHPFQSCAWFYFDNNLLKV